MNYIKNASFLKIISERCAKDVSSCIFNKLGIQHIHYTHSSGDTLNQNPVCVTG